MVRAMVGFLGARGAARRPLGRRPAGRAQAAGAALDVELAAPGVLAFGRPAGLVDRGAGAAARQAVEDRPAAAGAETGGAAFDVLLPFRRLALVAARCAGRPALDGWSVPAPDAEARFAPLFLAPLALGAAAPPFGFRVRAAVELAGGLARRIAGPLGFTALLQARLAGSTVRCRLSLAASGANTLCNAPRLLAAGPLAFGGTGLVRVAARFAFRPQPGVAGAARPVPLVGTRGADAALRRGRPVSASGTKTLRNAGSRAPAEAFAVGRTSGQSLVTPAACGRREGRSQRTPTAVCRPWCAARCR